MDKQISDLLNQVAKIKVKTDAVLDATGARYNIFRILNVSDDEIAFSRVIENLLDTKGSHGQKGQFIQEFIKIIAPEILDQYIFDFDSAYVEKEHYIGHKKNYTNNNQNPTGGRIDILLEIPRNNNIQKMYGIIIENKIKADDQEHQLIRYNNFAKEKYGKINEDYKIFYLTLYGCQPSEKSCGFDINKENVEENMFWTPISYSEHICGWLENCIKNAVQFPLLRETLVQFKNQIDHLTGQNKMTDEQIEEILIKPENIRTAQLIASNYQKLKIKQAKKLHNLIADEIKKNFSIKKEEHKKFGFREYGYNYKDKKWKYTYLHIVFEDTELTKFKINIAFVKNLNEEQKINIQYKFDSLLEWPVNRGKSVNRKIYKDSSVWMLETENILKDVKDAINAINSFENTK